MNLFEWGDALWQKLYSPDLTERLYDLFVSMTDGGAGGTVRRTVLIACVLLLAGMLVDAVLFRGLLWRGLCRLVARLRTMAASHAAPKEDENDG